MVESPVSTIMDKDSTRFLTASAAEMISRGWEKPDIHSVSGDVYVDHPSFGIPLLTRMLERKGFRRRQNHA